MLKAPRALLFIAALPLVTPTFPVVVQSLNVNDNTYVTGFAEGNYAYLVPGCTDPCGSPNGVLTRVDLTTFDAGGVTTLDLPTFMSDTSLTWFTGGFSDGNHGYLIGYKSGKVVKFDLANFGGVGSVTVLDVGGQGLPLYYSGGFCDRANGFGYMIPGGSGGNEHENIVRFQLSDMTLAGKIGASTILSDTDLKSYLGSMTDGTYGYALCTISSHKVVRWRLDGWSGNSFQSGTAGNLEVENLLPKMDGIGKIRGATHDGTYGYGFPDATGKQVMRWDLSDFTQWSWFGMMGAGPFKEGFVHNGELHLLPFETSKVYKLASTTNWGNSPATNIVNVHVTLTSAAAVGYGGFVHGDWAYSAPYPNNVLYRYNVNELTTITTTTTTSTLTSSTTSLTSASTTTSSTMSTTVTSSSTTTPTTTSSSSLTSTTTPTTTTSSTSLTSSTSTSTATSTLSSSSSSSSSMTSTASSSSSTSSTITSSTSTSSTSVSSTSSSSSSSSSTATSTTTLTLPLIDTWPELYAFTRFHERDVISKLNLPNRNDWTKVVPGAVISGTWLRAANTATYPSRYIDVAVQGTDASVRLPLHAILRRVNRKEVIVVATFFRGLQPPGEKDRGGRPVEVHSMASVNVFSPAGEELTVDELNESMTVRLPVNHTEESPMQPPPDCGFWHEADKVWDDLKKDLTWGQISCSTSHLTFFASILKGFLDALMCSQLGLYSLDSMARLFKGDWHRSSVAVAFWLFETALVILLVAACVMDRRARRGRCWDDRDYLIPSSTAAVAHAESTLGEAEEEAMATAQGCFASCKDSVSDCGVCKDILDELISSKIAWFSRLRSLCEGISGEIGEEDEGEDAEAKKQPKVMRIMNSIIDSLVAQSARSQVAFSLGLSNDTVNFVISDEDFGDNVLKADAGEATGAWRGRLEAWQGLHAEVLSRTDTHWRSHDWRFLPFFAARLLIVANPIVGVLLHDCFVPSSMRALLFAAELLGASMTACLFFAGTGSATSALNGAECTEPKDIWEELGQIIAVATVSLILGGIPVSVISSLHSRGFKQMDKEGSEQWKRQLKLWRTQDKLFWVLGSLYVAFCSFTIMLFLANVNVVDLPEWGTASLAQVVEDTLVMPAIVAAFMPVITMLALVVVSCAAGLHHKVLLDRRKLKLEKGKGNWSLTKAAQEPSRESPEGGYLGSVEI